MGNDGSSTHSGLEGGNNTEERHEGEVTWNGGQSSSPREILPERRGYTDETQHIPQSRNSDRQRSPTRVRFSQDTDQRLNVVTRDHTRNGASTSNATISDRNRNRGYSLRRSLFTHNIQKQDDQHGTAMEMEPSSSAPQQPSMLERKDRKGSVVITVDDEEEHSARVEQNQQPGRDLDLPVYSQWMKKQGPKWNFLSPFILKYRSVKKRLSRFSEIPPSIDGRHVKVNTDASFAPVDERTNKPYISNIIRSCKYTAWNFFPKQLVAQFGKLANFYFLIVSILQMIPGLSTTGTYTTIVPLLIFVGISMAKEGYDDIRRNRLDKEENEREALVLDSQKLSNVSSEPGRSESLSTHNDFKPEAWRAIKWQDVRVGDVILLKRDAPVPADIVLLRSTGVDGAAYVETKSLDGETNLKTKRPLEKISERCSDEIAISNLEADFILEDPNIDLYKFDGKLSVGGETLPLTLGEVMYRGSILRNTVAVMGLVVYSGEECKIRMNANKNPRVKAPTLQAKVNRVVILVACLVLFIAVIMSIAYLIWKRAFENKSWFLEDADVPFGQILTSFIIMFNTMLPLSLYVSLEIVKVIQMFMMNDIDMYDPESDTPMEPRTSTINEELGQVSYIFSDKTGTLTNNSMKFRKMSIAGTAWLHDKDLQEDAMRETSTKLKHKKRKDKGKSRRKSSTKPGRSSKSAPTDHEADPQDPATKADFQPQTQQPELSQCGRTEELLDYIYHRPQSVFARKAQFFLLSLALCHTCIPEKDDAGNIDYQASSPDELALVTAAQELGYIVTGRVSNTITVKTYPAGDDSDPTYETYEILDVIEFSSARKRMSVVVRFPDSRICVISKGADTTIRQLLRLADLAETFVNEISRRTNIRKSMEAQAAIKRRSTQIGRSSLSSNVTTPIGTRQTSVSMDRKLSIRQSVDSWLRERETDSVTASRRSNNYHSPRTSTQAIPARGSNVRPSVGSFNSPRESFQSENMDHYIDEAVVVNDQAIFERCFTHIDDFAVEGLRTLLYAYRYLSNEEYREWKEIYHAATTSLVDRQEKIEKAGELIEKDLELIGATAIEDKLQKGVPDAIDRFRRAGIKLWMLTGDKRETAINIGHSCRLIKDYSTIVILDHTIGDLAKRMTDAIAQIRNTHTAHSVLVIDGQTLTVIDSEAPMKSLFADLAISADSVICCRASPSQKAGLVKTIRTKVAGSVTLAIGDGANDIAMIQEAHLGIGIAGKEGLQAARTSDYSIAQFRFLLKLLLVHGRWNYVRVCKYTLGTFWKEMLFYLVQAMYQRWTGYTGTSLYEPWSLSMFNTLFTSLPVIFMGAFEKDLSASTLLAVPELYAIGQRNQGFNIMLYLCWATFGAIEAVIVYFIMFGIYGEALFTRDNQLFAMGALAFTTCVTIISLKLQFIELHNKSITAGIAIFLSVGGWWLWNLILSAIYDKNNVIYNVNGGLVNRFGKNPLWWLTLIANVMAIVVLELLVKSVKTIFFPNDTELFQAYERDLETKKRFEESAADLLQQGWNRGTKKSSTELAQEEQLQAQREAEVQEMLDRPRTMEEEPSPQQPSSEEPTMGFRKRSSWQVDEIDLRHTEQANTEPTRKSLDVAELFSKGFGVVRKGTLR